MNGPIQPVADLLFFLLVGLVSVGLGGQLLRWLRTEPAGLCEAVALGGALGLAVLAYTVWGVAALGFLYPAVGWGVLALAALVGGRRAARVVVGALARVHPGWRHVRVPEAFLWVCLLSVLAAGLVKSLAPPVANDWDALQYHLAFPKIYVAHHRLLQLPFSTHSYFPFTMEMLYTLGLLVRSVAAAKLFHFLTACLLAATMLAWGQRLGGRLVGLIAASVFLSTPVVFSELGSGYVDLGLSCYAVAALYALSRWQEGGKGRWHLVAGVFAGVCLGIKYTGAVTLAFVLFAGALHVVRSRRSLWTQWALLGIVAILVGGPWYLENQLQTGNPVYPFLYERFGGVRWDQTRADAYSAEQHTYGTGRGLVDLVKLPWNVTMWPWNHDPSRGLRYEVQPVSSSTPGPLYLALLLPFLFLRPKPGGVRLCAAAAAFHLLAWFALMHYLRYLLPCLAMTAVCLGWTVRELWLRTASAKLGFAAAAAVALFVPLGGWFALGLTGPAWQVVSGSVSADEYRTRYLDTYAAAQFANQFLPADAKLITYGEPRGLYLDRDYLWGEPDHSALLDYSKVKTRADLWRLFAGRGITHVLVNTTYFNLNDPGLLQTCIREGIDSGDLQVLYEDRRALVLSGPRAPD
ncbi:MAG: hypothetical protein COY42_08470 [Armatimonadetes bacterium CG_4_10_14_0_8_um_filter_66_14]|nr:DUF2029 domain-containing protein [Armatimonadota bacterium]PIZ47470.1 MAG: hypothetical protein COY42_08470 [Armatimonadetes bacterium CG_4_10_14_0_8_um_filter_66_14]